MAYALTTPIPAGAGQRGETTARDICAHCERYACTECAAQAPELGCCCGLIPAVRP